MQFFFFKVCGQIVFDGIFVAKRASEYSLNAKDSRICCSTLVHTLSVRPSATTSASTSSPPRPVPAPQFPKTCYIRETHKHSNNVAAVGQAPKYGVQKDCTFSKIDSCLFHSTKIFIIQFIFSIVIVLIFHFFLHLILYFSILI